MLGIRATIGEEGMGMMAETFCQGTRPTRRSYLKTVRGSVKDNKNKGLRGRSSKRQAPSPGGAEPAGVFSVAH